VRVEGELCEGLGRSVLSTGGERLSVLDRGAAKWSVPVAG